MGSGSIWFVYSSAPRRGEAGLVRAHEVGPFVGVPGGKGRPMGRSGLLPDEAPEVGLTHEGPAETSVSSSSSAPMDRHQSSSCPTAAQLVHGGRELWVTRKGAIRAGTRDLGVIPGSMGTRSYIVAGKGNEASWTSCSDCAGRRHSRTKARKLFTNADLATAMAGKV